MPSLLLDEKISFMRNALPAPGWKNKLYKKCPPCFWMKK
jgi:hypothetical protein